MILTKYISEKQNSSLLLIGARGLSMKEDALALAKHLLNTTSVENHSDFLYVGVPDGKESIGVTDVLPIVGKGAMPPIHAKCSVVVLDNMDRLTVSAQNKLLILLESNPYVIVIGIAYEDNLLDTVKSRMKIVRYPKPTKGEFLKIHPELGDAAEYFYHITDGCPGILDEISSEKSMLLSLLDIKKRPKELFRLLHLVKEKDSKAVTGNSQLMLYVIRALAYIFHTMFVEAFDAGELDETMRCLEIYDRLSADEQLCQKSVYSKNDFFKLITYCVER